MNIATGDDYTYETDIYVNTRNSSRFGIEPSEFEDGKEFKDLHKSDLRKEKSLSISVDYTSTGYETLVGLKIHTL